MTLFTKTSYNKRAFILTSSTEVTRLSVKDMTTAPVVSADKILQKRRKLRADRIDFQTRQEFDLACKDPLFK